MPRTSNRAYSSAIADLLVRIRFLSTCQVLFRIEPHRIPGLTLTGNEKTGIAKMQVIPKAVRSGLTAGPDVGVALPLGGKQGVVSSQSISSSVNLSNKALTSTGLIFVLLLVVPKSRMLI
ncbi:hypothetical protein ElyMa_003643400 [Elysia marginata]|uniref:Uncharacterized protein n=1 Tax=Elysia marginata TaxID=1093978 RepID=A0AAV4EVY3_9GAST|nr:hypothetical protein ElyMa_003643400 [Elysia marginata]